MMSTISIIQLIQKLEPYYVVIDQKQSIVLISSALDNIFPNIKSNKSFSDLFKCNVNFDSNPQSLVVDFFDQKSVLKFHYLGDHIICHINELSIKNSHLPINKVNREIEEIIDAELKLHRRLTQTEGFVRATVHDLGAPINNLKALIKLYEIEKDDNEQLHLFELLKKSVEMLSTRQKYVSKLIKDDYLLDEEAMGPLELHAPLNEIIEEFEPLFKSQNGWIEKNIPTQTIVHFSPTGLRSVFENLLSNSLKYKKSNDVPVAKINCIIEKQHVVIHYSDNGRGMDIAKFNQNPFGLYRRFDDDDASGSGLGLYITKSHIEKAEGRIEIDSQPDQGVTFKITLNIPAK